MAVGNVDIVSFIQNNWFAITTMATVVGFTVKSTRRIDKFTTDTLHSDERLNTRIDTLQKDVKNDIVSLQDEVFEHFKDIDMKIEKQEQNRKDSQERTKIIMQGVEATLHSLHDDGHNGPVTDALKQMDEYKLNKAVE